MRRRLQWLGLVVVVGALVLAGWLLLAGGAQRSSHAGTVATPARAAPSGTPGPGRFDLVQALTRTATPPPRFTPSPEPPPVEQPRVAAHGYVQERQQVTVAYVLENPNADAAFTRITARIVLHDAAGSALLAQQQTVDVLLPGERLGSVQVVSAPADTPTRSVSIEIVAARPSRQPPEPLFTAEETSYTAVRGAGRVTGRIRNPHEVTFEKLRLVAVAYDRGGAIIGGGTAVLNHLPAKGVGAADVPVKTAAPPARVELFATFTSASRVSR